MPEAVMDDGLLFEVGQACPKDNCTGTVRRMSGGGANPFLVVCCDVCSEIVEGHDPIEMIIP